VRRNAPAIVAIGECMVELLWQESEWVVGYGGDTYNTAVYLSRFGHDIAYLTATGNDPFSAAMRLAWQTEGIRQDFALTAPHRLPGLYAIQTDLNGERNFYYWREQAAVRDLFSLVGCSAALERAAEAQLLYISGISLALFDRSGRSALKDLAQKVRSNGGDVAFDPNYRAALWPFSQDARDAINAFAPTVSIAMPTFADEASLYGDLDPAQTDARWRDAGAREIVVKLGGAGCQIDGGTIIAPAVPVIPVDTTGAGDAFNAGYLAARLRYSSVRDAAAFANLLAGRVIGNRGAIMPRVAMPDLPAGQADQTDAVK
jgi:2-dehydro-3-deoxygluconokinase